jgi:hypothetical protein
MIGIRRTKGQNVKASHQSYGLSRTATAVAPRAHRIMATLEMISAVDSYTGHVERYLLVDGRAYYRGHLGTTTLASGLRCRVRALKSWTVWTSSP